MLSRRGRLPCEWLHPSHGDDLAHFGRILAVRTTCHREGVNMPAVTRLATIAPILPTTR